MDLSNAILMIYNFNFFFYYYDYYFDIWANKLHLLFKTHYFKHTHTHPIIYKNTHTLTHQSIITIKQQQQQQQNTRKSFNKMNFANYYNFFCWFFLLFFYLFLLLVLMLSDSLLMMRNNRIESLTVAAATFDSSI